MTELRRLVNVIKYVTYLKFSVFDVSQNIYYSVFSILVSSSFCERENLKKKIKNTQT